MAASNAPPRIHHQAARTTQCPECGETVGTYDPPLGDGSYVKISKHTDPMGDPCDGQDLIIRDVPIQEQ